ncbi:MAG TPA: 2'-deoxycytidine 5'-triphosphate deaminase [Xanthobacteraceae bacterium]|nr:2'-deoxycytidine 5'-triphosphate deaminase [Xanthobacteraceae bacterium]
MPATSAGMTVKGIFIVMSAIVNKPADILREPTGPLADLGTRAGLLPRQRIKGLIRRRMIQASSDIDETQIQPASLDLRLGTKAYRVPASFLPGKAKTVEQQLAELEVDEINLEAGAVLERGTVYLVELMEHLSLPESVSALANPKSSTGRLDVFTRLIADHSDMFDNVPGGYQGPIYTEISPSSFSIRVRKGSRLNQIRFRRRNPAQAETARFALSDRELLEQHRQLALVDGEIQLRNGLVLSVDLSAGEPGGLVGYRAQKFTGVIDVDSIAEYDPRDFWEQVHVRNYNKLILDPNQFYILASRERIHIPPDWAAEMVPIDPMMGEFRVHYAGFFDPGFGFTEEGRPGSRAVLEVRSHEVPFVLEHGQAIGRLIYEPMAETPDVLYGQTDTSNYQGQSLKLSKHFRV